MKTEEPTAVTEAAKTPINGNTYGNTYTVEDTDGNQVTLDDVASASSLKTVAENSADINLSNLSEGGKTAITNLAKGVEKHIEGKEYKVSADGTVTMSYVDGNGESVSGEAKITGLATKDAVDNAAKDAKKHTTVKLVEGEGNLTLAKGQNTNEGIEYTLGLAKALNVDSVNAGGTVIDSKGLSIEKTTYVSADGLNAGKKVITNVADGKADSDAVNYGQLKNYVGTNATYKSGNGIAINNDREISVALAENSGLHFEGGKLANDLQVTADENGGTNGGNWTVTDSEQNKTFTKEAAKTPINGNTYGNTYTVEDTDGNQVTLDDVASASKLKEVAAEVGKHTSMTVDGGKAAGTAEYNGGNLLLKDNGKDGQHQYDVKLNDDIYLGGNQTADNRNIALEGSTGSIHAATTEGNNTFDFDSNGGKFETTTVDDSLLVDKPWIGKNGIVTTTTNTSEFNQSGATFTKTGKVETYLGDQVITTTLIPKTFTNIDGSKITSDAGVLGGQTVVDGGSVTVQGAGSVLGTHTTTVEGSKITSVGTWGSLFGDTTEIDGAYINAGGIEVNGEPRRGTITGLSNTEWKNNEAWQKANIRDDRAATEGQLQDVADSLSGDVSKLDDFAVKYDEVNGKPDYSTVTLEGTNGTKITNLAKGEVTATSTDAVNGSQLFEVQELAGKHTTMTVNNGMAAPEDDSYTTDGNLQLKQKVGDKGRIEYDVKLNDNLVLGKGDSQITLNGAPTDENAPAISVGEVFTVGQDGSVHAAVAGDSTSDSMSFTNGGLTISNMSGDVSSATVIKGADIQAGGIHLDGTDKIIDGLSNTKWTGMTTTPDKAATEGQLQMVSDTVASGWTATDDKGHKINVNPNTHPTLNFASGKNITVSAENDEINVALNDNVYLGEDNAIALEGSTGHISATVKVKDSLGMSSNTLTFDDKGLTVSKDAMGVGSGSTNIIGDTITTTDENGNETTIDGGKVTTEALEVNGNSDNTMTFDAEGLNVNTGDAQLNVSEDGLSLNVDNGAGWNNSVKITQDGTTFSYSENGVTGATTTVIQGQKITAGDVLINGEDGKNTITGLTNTTWKNDAAWQADNIVADRAATEGQLQKAAAAATTTVTEGKNIDVNKTIDKEDGHTNYEVALQDNVSLGDGKIILNGKPEEGDDLLNVDNKLVVAQDGTTTIAVNDGTVAGGGNNTTVTVAADGVKFAGNSNGTTIINGQTIQAGGIYINDEETKGTIVGLSNTEWTGSTNEPSRAATEGQLQQAAAASKTTLSNGTNTTVTSKTAEDGHVDYQVNLNDHIVLGDQDGKNNNISINGNKASIILNGFENGEYKNSIEIDAASGTITGLTNAIGDGKDGWETFTDEDTVHGSRAVTEDDLYKVYRHGVQYSVNDDGTPDYTTIVLGNPYNANTKGGGTRITNVAYATGENGSEAVNVDYLKDQISNATTTVTANEKHIATNDGPNPDVAGGQFSVKDGKITLVEVNGNGETTGNTVVIDNVASASDLGDVTQIHDGLMNKDENGNNMDTSVVDAVNNLDDKVGSGDFTGTTHITNPGDTNLTDAIKDLDSAITNAQTEAGKHSTVSTVDGDKNIIVNDINTDPSKGANYQISLNKDLNVDTVTASGNIDAGSFSSGNITINKDNSGTINGLSNKTWDAAKDYSDSGMAATEAQLQKATEGAVQYDRNEDGTVNKDSITLGGSTYDPETHKGGTTITNVADGKNASDAVNMSQLWQTNQAVINNSNNISMLSNSVNKLDNRIDRVGAGAAALAALHPLDFDPDAKWDFAAGYGNYRGANAVAVGAYYRPNEDVMFSVGGSMGGGENMVNAGVSLKIGAGSSNVTTSRVAMAKEIKSMRDIVAKQDAQIQKLTAMVNALVGIQSEPDMTTMFPDVPENHWAYEAVEAMAKSGLVKGYPDGEFKGDRTMTRYEFAQIVYNAIQAGAEVDARLVEEFKPELEYFHIATVAKDKDGNPTIERVRAN
ncbi:S-layer homology domain-containing protein [uncultured Megasphaera sp.]|uniref:S-layer homology domain-containing protein n=1 Tax=uncultured Megasphaera sp. TaxID=165188 RepID=UPI002612856B|nr:S-layer homology domain-containing protein [uncultured Megasphaera sp.]